MSDPIKCCSLKPLRVLVCVCVYTCLRSTSHENPNGVRLTRCCCSVYANFMHAPRSRTRAEINSFVDLPLEHKTKSLSPRQVIHISHSLGATHSGAPREATHRRKSVSVLSRTPRHAAPRAKSQSQGNATICIREQLCGIFEQGK